ncbi:hypothetical protein [Paenibacillus hexagrammi]|nr:hypothetical protein [Paenibacillus sp. YPD9-1]
MQPLWQFLTHHWISIASIIGSLLAVLYVYKNKEKLLADEDN